MSITEKQIGTAPAASPIDVGIIRDANPRDPYSAVTVRSSGWEADLSRAEAMVLLDLLNAAIRECVA